MQDKMGIDTFVGGHSFGEDIDWGGNAGLPSHPKVCHYAHYLSRLFSTWLPI